MGFSPTGHPVFAAGGTDRRYSLPDSLTLVVQVHNACESRMVLRRSYPEAP